MAVSTGKEAIWAEAAHVRVHSARPAVPSYQLPMSFGTTVPGAVGPERVVSCLEDVRQVLLRELHATVHGQLICPAAIQVGHLHNTELPIVTLLPQMELIRVKSLVVLVVDLVTVKVPGCGGLGTWMCSQRRPSAPRRRASAKCSRPRQTSEPRWFRCGCMG